MTLQVWPGVGRTPAGRARSRAHVELYPFCAFRAIVTSVRPWHRVGCRRGCGRSPSSTLPRRGAGSAPRCRAARRRNLARRRTRSGAGGGFDRRSAVDGHPAAAGERRLRRGRPGPGGRPPVRCLRPRRRSLAPAPARPGPTGRRRGRWVTGASRIGIDRRGSRARTDPASRRSRRRWPRPSSCRSACSMPACIRPIAASSACRCSEPLPCSCGCGGCGSPRAGIARAVGSCCSIGTPMTPGCRCQQAPLGVPGCAGDSWPGPCPAPT